jgi:hypothetical protein
MNIKQTAFKEKNLRRLRASKIGLDVFHCSAGTNLVFGKVINQGMYTGHPEQGGLPVEEGSPYFTHNWKWYKIKWEKCDYLDQWFKAANVGLDPQG